MWKDKLDALPMHFPRDRVFPREDCLAGNSGKASYVAARLHTYELGPAYHFAICGSKADRKRLLAKLTAELGNPTHAEKDADAWDYWWKIDTAEQPKHSTYNLLGGRCDQEDHI